jgi:hypothetical protein
MSVERVTLDDFNSIPSGPPPGAKHPVNAKHPLDAKHFVDAKHPRPSRAESETSECPRPANNPASRSGNGAWIGDPRTIRDAPALALAADILGRFVADLRLAGVAGGERLAKLCHLALTSRVLPWGRATNRPVSVIAKGTSSTGKSHTTQTVLRFFPPSAYLDLSSMSPKYLFYCEEDLAHRFIVVAEASGIVGDHELLTALRTLLSEGRIVHGTVEGEGKKKGRRIEKEGPTGLLMTTTLAAVDHEMETRCLSLITDDSPEQTRRVFTTLAELEDEDECPVDFENWHQLQEWVAEGESRVTIPYVKRLAHLMPNGPPRLRRDFVSLVCLVRAHAILHRASRDSDAFGRIIATPADYAVVRDLCSDLVAEGADAGVPDAIRETVEATRELLQAGAEAASVKSIADKLGIGLPATYDRVRRALRLGYLVDTSSQQEKTKKLVVGASLPGEREFLPTIEAIEAVLGSVSDQASEATIPVAARDSELTSDTRTTQTTASEDISSDEVERLAKLIPEILNAPEVLRRTQHAKHSQTAEPFRHTVRTPWPATNDEREAPTDSLQAGGTK